MKLTILSSTILELNDPSLKALWEVSDLAALHLKRKLNLQEMRNFPSPQLQDAKKNYFWVKPKTSVNSD